MTVYLIQADENGPVKIGSTENIAGRLSKMQSDNCCPLKVLRLLDGGKHEEEILQARFARQWLRGEWFTFSPDMLGDLGLSEVAAPKRCRVLRRLRPEPGVENLAPLIREITALFASRRRSA